MRILRSKPVLILGGGALLRRIVNNAQMRRKKRRGTGRKVSSLILASAAGGAIRYFSDSVSGPRRRQKVMRLLGKAEQGQDAQAPESSGTDGDSPQPVEMQDSGQSQT